MRPTVTTIADLWDTAIVSPAVDDVLIYRDDKWTNIPLSGILADTLDDVAERGAATDQVLSVGGINTAGGDADDYLELVTESNAPIIRAIGGQTVYVESDDAAFVRVRLRSGLYQTELVLTKTTGNLAINCTGNIAFGPGGGEINCLLGTLTNVVARMYDGLPDAFAQNLELYYSSDRGKLCFKDAGGVVRALY